jgi:hypothetical protein
MVTRKTGDLLDAARLTSELPTDLRSLRNEIAACSPGERVLVNYEDYADLFPPGEPDVDARENARRFAAENGCWFVIHPTEKVVVFIKRA